MTTKETLLSLLESQQGSFFSGEELAQELQVSRAAVWKAVNALRQEGFAIDAATNRGYCLSRDADVLSVQGIRKHLAPENRDNPITLLPTVPSTNAAAREQAEQGAPSGSVVLACTQTRGRGRYGRSFFSPADTGLYLSILLRPSHTSPRQTVTLTAAAAVAMCQAIESVCDEAPQIKWVNDIYMNGKKICGILTEAAFGLETGVPEYVVVGAGLNVYTPEGGFPPELTDIAGSLLSHRAADARNHLAAEFINRFLSLAQAQPEDFLEDYRRRSLVLGKRVTVLSGDKEQEALALGIDDHCRLVVRYGSGETQTLSWGEIRIRPEKSQK